MRSSVTAVGFLLSAFLVLTPRARATKRKSDSIASPSAASSTSIVRILVSNTQNPIAAGDLVFGISAAGEDGNGNVVYTGPFTWSSSDPSVAWVTGNGVVGAFKAGTAVISASAAGVSGSISLTITPGITFSYGPEETVYDWATDRCETGDISDIPPDVVRLADGTLIMTDGAGPKNYVLAGADFSSLHKLCAAPALGSDESPYPNDFDNVQWLQSIYRVGDTIHALVHNEYHDPFATDCKPGDIFSDNPCWYNSVNYASSTDGGHNFRQATPPMQVIAPPAIQWNPQGPPPPYGYFSPSNIVYRSDGFYYAMFQTSTPNASYGVCLVRTQDLADPTSWRAWDGSGFNLQFLDPYTGPAGQFCPDVVGWGNPGTLTYNTYLERYMWVTFGFIGTGTPQDLCAFLLSSSKDLIHWSPMRILRQTYFPFFAPHCFPPKSVPSDDYAAIIDQNDSTINFEAPGENPDLYYTRFNDYPTNLYDRDLVRRTMTITVPDIAVEVSPSLTTAFSGQAANFFGSLRTSNGNNQPADLSCGIGHPAICGPSSPSLLPSASGTAFTVTASDTTPGDYKFDVIADGAYMTRSQALELRVIDFAISAPMPSSINVAQGNPSAPIQLSVTGLGPFDRSVTFSCAGLPAGANCLFSPSDTIHPGSGSPANVMLIINSNTASVGGPVNVTISAAAAGDPRPAKTTSLQLTITNGSGVSADLSAAITHANPPSNQPLGVGQQIIWKAVAMNHGPSNNIPSILLVTFSNVVSLGPAPAGCTNNSQTNSVSCAASLNSGSSSGFNIPVVVPFTHDVTAMAVVSSAASDPGPGNNLSSDTVQVRPRPLARRGLPVANP